MPQNTLYLGANARRHLDETKLEIMVREINAAIATITQDADEKFDPDTCFTAVTFDDHTCLGPAGNADAVRCLFVLRWLTNEKRKTIKTELKDAIIAILENNLCSAFPETLRFTPRLEFYDLGGTNGEDYAFAKQESRGTLTAVGLFERQSVASVGRISQTSAHSFRAHL